MSSNSKGNRRTGLFLPFLLVGVLVFPIVFWGCSRLEGWGVVIWSVKGTTAKAGTVVPVYLKSNISKTFVIGLPDDSKTKIEVPLSTLEFFSSKKAAEKRASEFAPYASLYLSAGRDGLPIREKPSVSTRRVYRLRLGESVKVLGKASGEAVFTGGTALPGEWYFVQASDGTRGYVFSNTMVLYEEKENAIVPMTGASTSSAPSAALLDMIYARPWRPAYYQLMLDDNTVDPDLFVLQYGFFADAKNSQVRIELPGYSDVFRFSSVSQGGDWLIFEGSKLRVKFENESTIVADWSGTDPVLPDEGWAPDAQSARFIKFDTSIPVVLSGENSRRDSELKAFFQRSMLAQSNSASTSNSNAIPPSTITFISDIAGILSVEASGRFEWSHTEQLPAGFVPEILANSSGTAQGGSAASDASGAVYPSFGTPPKGTSPSSTPTNSTPIKGKIRFGLHLGVSLSSAWMGGFSLLVGDKPEREDYVYRFESGKLIIAKASPVTLRGTTESLDSRFSSATYYLLVK